MILPNSSSQQLSDNQSPTRGFTYFRRASTGTTSSPPPYSADKSPLIYDEKRRSGGVHSPEEESSIGMKEVYAELPPAFSRVAAMTTEKLTPFNPMVIAVGGSGRALDKGFPLEPPQSLDPLHPFRQRDIREEDWTRFMQDLQECTALSKCTKRKTLLIPVAAGLGPGAFLVSKAIKARIRNKKLGRAINLINTWNKHFFASRRVEVVLVKGESALTGTKSNLTGEQKLAPGNQSLASLSSDGSTSTSTSSRPSKRGCGCRTDRRPMKLVVVPL